MSPHPLARVATTDVREKLADLVNAVAYGNARIVFQRHGRDVAALVSIEDLKQLGVRLGRDVPEWPDTILRRSG
jgi:prevent-host-death family protein